MDWRKLFLSSTGNESPQLSRIFTGYPLGPRVTLTTYSVFHSSIHSRTYAYSLPNLLQLYKHINTNNYYYPYIAENHKLGRIIHVYE